MFHMTSWHATEAGRPAIQQAKTMADLLYFVYWAGRDGRQVVIDEYASSEIYGEECVTLFDSTAQHVQETR